MREIADTLGADDSIYLSLKRHRVPEAQVLELIKALRQTIDPRTDSHPGDSYLARLDPDGAVLTFEYSPAAAPERPVLVERSGGQLRSRQAELLLQDQWRVLELVIDDNLSSAVAAGGETDALTDLLADVIFGSTIDFHRDPRRGDRIDLVFTRQYMDDRFVRYGRVYLARYRGEAVSQTAIWFDGAGGAGYFDDGGTSLERMFLLKPLAYRRISSHFSRNRLHPILKRERPHLGTDYAAAQGTEVYATAPGRVVAAGWKGGLGRMVEIDHPNGYRTRYGHLSRTLVRQGQRVAKGEVIGRVGATGLATGPHLHYELLRNGQHLNPLVANRGSRSRALTAAERPAFAEQLNEMLAILAVASPAARRASAVAAAP
ncbi:MAG: M23 family metallopeptidase [Gemmatimonadota bacterium]